MVQKPLQMMTEKCLICLASRTCHLNRQESSCSTNPGVHARRGDDSPVDLSDDSGGISRRFCVSMVEARAREEAVASSTTTVKLKHTSTVPARGTEESLLGRDMDESGTQEEKMDKL